MWQLFSRLWVRFRYPISLPEEIAADLGLPLSNNQTFQECVNLLMSPRCRPSKLTRWMPREEVEELFQGAYRKESFRHNTLFSYYFNEGWVEFVLQFDSQSRLRRLYLQHKNIREEPGVEIRLNAPQTAA